MFISAMSNFIILTRKVRSSFTFIFLLLFSLSTLVVWFLLTYWFSLFYDIASSSHQFHPIQLINLFESEKAGKTRQGNGCGKTWPKETRNTSCFDQKYLQWRRNEFIGIITTIFKWMQSSTWAHPDAFKVSRWPCYQAFASWVFVFGRVLCCLLGELACIELGYTFTKGWIELELKADLEKVKVKLHF